MSSDKSTVLRGFNNLFFEFIADLVLIFPENSDIKEAKVAFEFFKKANPTAIIKCWQYFVCDRYSDVIAAGNLSFFFDKDYSSDLNDVSKSDEILKAIDKIREPVKQMDEKNKETALKYLKNLCTLSNIYSKV